MAETLLRTKLYIPPLRPNLVPRPRLLKRLNQAHHPGHKLTLISAPAGFGKSTLVSCWVQKAELRPEVAWLSLDEGDNDLTRFLIYLVAALQTINSKIGSGQMAALLSPEAINVEAVLTTLLNEINEFSDEGLLVIDDYHVIESHPVDQAVTFLLEHLPPHMQILIASRIDPSLPLSRLRARGQMTEIRAHDLRFTTDEAAAFLNQVLDFALSAQDIAALEAHTEGWIAGLQLVAISMQGLKRKYEIVDFINSFTGSHRYIQDYLADEVLQQQSSATKDFLLQTSILKRLNAPLCNAVTEQQNSQAILENLEAANLFINSLDNERRWYRYHHLFAELLVHRLKLAAPERIPILQRRASIWYENEGYLDEAIYHAQATDDIERITEILEEHWQETVNRGETIKLQRWLDAIGPEITEKSAPLSMAYCWIHVLNGTNGLIPSHLADVKKAYPECVDGHIIQQPMRLAVIPSLVETMEATVALDRKQAQEAKAHAQKAILLIPETANPTVRGLLHGAAAYRLAMAHRESGEYEQSCAVLLAGLEMLKASENHFGVAATILQIVAIYQASGRAPEAARLCEDTLDFIAENHWQNMAPSGVIHVVLAGLQADAGDYEAAQENFDAGQGRASQLGSQYIHTLLEGVEKKLDGVPPLPQPLFEPLSPRELEVLEMIAKGHSNREIGEQLFLALDTVKGHNRNIYGKLGVKNRTQAVNKATSLKIISQQ